MKQTNDDKFNNYNIIGYMFDKPAKPKQSRFATVIAFNNLFSDVKKSPYYTITVRSLIILIAMLAFSKFLNGRHEPTAQPSLPIAAQTEARIDTIATPADPIQAINTANLDNSLAKAKEVFDSFEEIEGESPIDNMKRMNQHIMESTKKYN